MKPSLKLQSRGWLAAALICAFLLSWTVTAAADDCKRIPNILILFDASGYMKNKNFYEMLLRQMELFSQALPLTADGFFSVGVRHFGLKVGLGCENTESILAVGPWDPERFINCFPKTVSYGVSSLAAGLRAAGDEMAGLSGKSVIIVVGAGNESCRADPMKITQQVVANNPDLEIHTFQIGGGTDGAFFMRGVAELGRGSYTSLDGVTSPAVWHAWMKRYLVMPCPASVPSPASQPQAQSVAPINFDPNSISVKSKNSTVTSANMASLQAVAQILRQNPSARVVLHGFSVEGTGNVKHSLKVSRQRAEAVAKFLISSFGVSSSQLGIVAHGAAKDKPSRTVEFEIR